MGIVRGQGGRKMGSSSYILVSRDKSQESRSRSLCYIFFITPYEVYLLHMYDIYRYFSDTPNLLPKSPITLNINFLFESSFSQRNPFGAPEQVGQCIHIHSVHTVCIHWVLFQTYLYARWQHSLGPILHDFPSMYVRVHISFLFSTFSWDLFILCN